MKIPKRIKKHVEQKQKIVDSGRSDMERLIKIYQGDLLKGFLSDISGLDVENGKIKDSVHNYRILSDIDKRYYSWNAVLARRFAKNVAETTGQIIKMNNEYMMSTVNETLAKRFARISESTAKLTDMRLGMQGGKMIRGGYLESIFKDGTVISEIKNYIAKSITGEATRKEFVNGLTELIEGVPKEVLIEGKKQLVQTGAFERKFRQTAFDLYQQYDRNYSDSLAVEFGMTYFIYMGGKVEDSRDFCVAHDGKVWSRHETGEWKNWTPSKGEYPAGYEVKAKDLYSVPSYMDYPGYDPLVDLGGYNCRHHTAWISDDMAFQLRPELKSKK